MRLLLLSISETSSLRCSCDTTVIVSARSWCTSCLYCRCISGFVKLSVSHEWACERISEYDITKTAAMPRPGIVVTEVDIRDHASVWTSLHAAPMRSTALETGHDQAMDIGCIRNKSVARALYSRNRIFGSQVLINPRSSPTERASLQGMSYLILSNISKCGYWHGSCGILVSHVFLHIVGYYSHSDPVQVDMNADSISHATFLSPILTIICWRTVT